MNTALPCRGRRALVYLAVALAWGWVAASSWAAIPPTFSLQNAIGSMTADDPGNSGPRLTPAAVPPPEDVIPPVETPFPVVQPPPVSAPLLPVIDIPSPLPAAEAPEPATLVMGLLGSGIASVLVLRRRRSREATD